MRARNNVTLKIVWRTTGEHASARMDEGRKRVILIAASILAARKLAQYEGGGARPGNDLRHIRRDYAGQADHAGD
jgi:hypothetical protein